MAHATAERIAAEVAAGPMTLGLAGGSTPADTYAALGDVEIDWARVTLWMSDERWVPHDHQDSNGRMALEHLPEAAHSRLVRPRFSPDIAPAESAAEYDATLRSIHRDGEPGLVLLGMGDDGHTASLFPGTAALTAEQHRWFVENHVPALDTWRLTVTPALLHAARQVFVLVAGSEKAQVLASAVEGPPGRHPVQLLHEAEGEVLVLCDEEAAGDLAR